MDKFMEKIKAWQADRGLEDLMICEPEYFAGVWTTLAVRGEEPLYSLKGIDNKLIVKKIKDRR